MSDPIAVSGIGIISPLGISLASFAPRLFAGDSGIAPLTLFATGEGGPRLAAQVDGFRPQDHLRPATARRMDRLSQMVAAAARMAQDDAGLMIDAGNRDHIGVTVGTCFGGTDVAATFGKVLFDEGPRRVNPILVPNTVMNAPAGHLAIELGVRGVNTTVNHREVSAETAIGHGAALLRRGRAAAIFAGGGDILSPFAMTVFARFAALSPGDGGEEGAFPFDRRANGLVLGEGTAMLCLEPLSRTRARGGRPYCLLAGCGMASAPAPATGWPTSPEGSVLAMQRALAAAGIEAAQVDVVCASANGAPALDRLEAQAIAQVFAGSRPRVVAEKGALGEGLSSGATRAAAMALSLRDQRLAPVVGLSQPIADFDFVRKGDVEKRPLRYGLVNGIAAGGTFVALVFKALAEGEGR